MINSVPGYARQRPDLDSYTGLERKSSRPSLIARRHEITFARVVSRSFRRDSMAIFQIQGRDHNHIQECRSHDPAQYHYGHRMLNLLARLARAQRQRKQADARYERRHQDRAEPFHRALHDSFAEAHAFLLH